MTAPATRPSALRPWLIVAVLLPLGAIVGYATGLFDAAPEAPIADRRVSELARGAALAPAPEPARALAPALAPGAPYRPRRPGRAAPLVMFIGDSRYLKATRAASAGFLAKPRATRHAGVDIELMTYFTRAGATLADIGEHVDSVLGWQPDVLVVQPEMFVEETSFRGLASPAFDEKKRLAQWQLRVDLWGDKAELPKAGKALPAGKALAERARSEGIALVVAQIPPSAKVAAAVPAGYYQEMRELVCSVLVDCARDYLTFGDSYPDSYFRDPLHLNNKGREVFFPKLMDQVIGVVRSLPTRPR